MSIGTEAPYEPLPAVQPKTLRAIEEAALHANDRYLTEVIERYAFCPYSKEGRAAGETRRFVHYADSVSVEPLLELFDRACESGVVVIQIILPLLEVDADAFQRLCAEVTDLGNKRLDEAIFAVAPLHPGLDFGEGAHAMVPLFRRAPDPTIQWVRLDGLQAIYQGRESDDHYVPPEQILAYLETNKQGKPRLYDRICETNAMMARRLGVERVVTMLADISTAAREHYLRLLLEDDL